MAIKISVDQMANELMRQLSEWSDEISEGVKQAAKKVAKQSVKDVKSASPVLTGDYKKGWKSKVAYESLNDIRVTVHNRTDYQLTHLLEHGHVMRSGGRVNGKAHIKPVEEQAIEQLHQEIEAVIKK